MDRTIKAFNFKKNLPLEFEIKELSDVKKAPHLFTGPSKATFYQLIWITEGQAIFDIDFKKVNIHAGELLLISVNQVYGFDVRSDYEGKMILFTDSFFNRTELDSHFLHTSDILNPVNLNQTVRLCNKLVKQLFDLLEGELNLTIDLFLSHIAQSFLRILLLEIERAVTVGTSPASLQENTTIGRRFCAEVEKHFKTNRQTDYYVQLMGVGEKVLSKEMKRLTGKTPKVYIDSRIILEAKRLLTYGSSTVKEISYELGFDEATNFNKFFRKHTGTSPVLFRQKSMETPF